MLYIAHRINTVAELKALPEGLGIELDLRDLGSRLIIQHDPFKEGEDFETYIQHVKNRFMILNIKSERIEYRVKEIIEAHQLHDFVFLDSSFPMMIQLSTNGETRQAVRFSEFESIHTILAMKNRVNWIWIDCFTKFPLTPETVAALKETGLKLCLVSPELVGRPQEISQTAKLLQRLKLIPDAICTKIYNIEEWKHALSTS